MSTFTVTMTFESDPFADVSTDEEDIRACAEVAKVLHLVAESLSGGAGGGCMPGGISWATDLQR
jgi:hypothetical protein